MRIICEARKLKFLVSRLLQTLVGVTIICIVAVHLDNNNYVDPTTGKDYACLLGAGPQSTCNCKSMPSICACAANAAEEPGRRHLQQQFAKD